MTTISDEDLQEVVRMAETVPEPYRLKCFELLLAHALAQLDHPIALPPAPPAGGASHAQDFAVPIDVKAFLTQYGLGEDVVHKYFLIQGIENRPIYKLTEAKKARAQVQHSLMMAFESALSTGVFEVGIEALRARCRDQKHYDGTNFSSIIKDNAHLYKAIEGVDTLVLTPDGKSELAELLEEMGS